MAVNRKEKIVDAALALFAKQGASFAKLADVAKAAKVPPPLIHYYYNDIEDLHYDVVIKVLESLKSFSVKNLDRHPNDSVKTMREYLRGALKWADQHTDSFSIWMYFYYMASRSKKFEALNTEIRKQGRERIAMMIYQGIERGQFKNSNNRPVTELAREIQAIITGHVILYGSESRDTQFSDSAAQLEKSVLSLLQVKA